MSDKQHIALDGGAGGEILQAGGEIVVVFFII